MAQLRDSRTSELVFEGTPLECVLVAEKMGGASVVGQLKSGTTNHGVTTPLIYDDVSMGFDPQAVLKAAQDSADGLARAASDPQTTKDIIDTIKQAAKDAADDLKVDMSAVSETEAAVASAREAQDKAHGGTTPGGRHKH